jgi:hypothetical protein
MAAASITLAEVEACGHINKNYQDTRSVDKLIQFCRSFDLKKTIGLSGTMSWEIFM